MSTEPKLFMAIANFLREDPPLGLAQIVLKLQGVDKDKIDTAAAALGMGQGKFMRIVAVSVAEYVLQELNVKVQETGKFIDLKKTQE